ncbi:MAG: hypothetical protein L6Q71_01330 [Planctomycetes bacterium]|nr:hypothetical protein [Planctomycetota bacterium]NUQ36041.1 hypothetical protein [Planctomycetaceae bacterium]
MGTARQPKVKAFLLCDQIIQGTDGKHSVIGVFQRINAVDYPVFHPRFGVYFRLGEMGGDYTFIIRFVDPNSEKVLGEAQLQGVSHKRPLEDFETGVNLPGIEIPHPGIFEVRLLGNGELLHVDTLRAGKANFQYFPKPGDGKEPGTPGNGPERQ